MSDDYPTAIDMVERLPEPYRQSNGRNWALGLSIGLSLIVCIRFFSESLGILPSAATYVDMPVTALLVLSAFFSRMRSGVASTRSGLGLIVLAFVTFTSLSGIVNFSRSELFAVLGFLYNYLAPFLVMLTILASPMGRRDVRLVARTFFWLGAVQMAVSLFFSIPAFVRDNNPDYISGTFGSNCYQFTYFMGLWLLYVIGGRLAGDSRRSRFGNLGLILAVAVVFALFYLAQFRGMILFFPLVLLVTLWLSPLRFGRQIFQTIVVAGVSAITLVLIATTYPNLKLLGTFDLLKDTSPIVHSGKAQVVRNIALMYGDLPHTIIVGSGPATFSSRTYKLFAHDLTDERTNSATSAQVIATGGVYSTDVARRYVETIEAAPIQGGTTASSPYSSYTTLAAELGLPGLLLYLAIYGKAFVYAYRRQRKYASTGNQLGFRLAFTSLGGLLLLLVQSGLDNWLETTRVSIPLWTLVGLMYISDRNLTYERNLE